MRRGDKRLEIDRNVSVGLQRRQKNVEDPEEEEETAGEDLRSKVAAELGASEVVEITTEEQDDDAHDRRYDEDDDGEAESAGLHFKLLALNGRQPSSDLYKRSSKVKMLIENVLVIGNVCNRISCFVQ